jgi:hypothetical protein
MSKREAVTPEQWARDLMEQCGWDDAQSTSSGDVVFLANRLAELWKLRAERDALLRDREAGK